jgi:NAD(P)-dependent dehydrogenase (short-subunit alcohol dehydrogenase family)
MHRNDELEALRGKVLLVTGSGRGLGAVLVRAAAQRRAQVVINCRADERSAQALAVEVRRAGGEALVYRADVSEHDQARALVDATAREFGRIDVLVNTVGAFSWKPVADLPPQEWRGVMASNLDSVFHMCRLVLPHMRRNHWGRIVNVGAVGAERALGQPQVSAYSAAKAAVIAFSRSLALEEARCGITVNVVSPGVLTDDGPAPLTGPHHAATNLGDRVPVGRAGSPEDVVRAVFFFASPAADFLTGQVLSVAGGWLL